MADHNHHGQSDGQRYIQSFVGYAPPGPVPASSSSSQYVYGQGGGYPPSAPVPAPMPVSSSSSPYGHGYGYGQGQGQGGYPPSSAYPPPMGGFVAFPPGTHPDVVRAFWAVDRDRSGSIDEKELQDALSDAYRRFSFSIRTVRLLMFLFSNNRASSPSRMGPAEFVSLWNCLRQWLGIFDKYDRDRSGKINSDELNEAFRGLGYDVPPSVIEALIANYNDGVSRRGVLDFDNFVECGMVVKGLTEKFKEKDTRYTGFATLNYDSFLSIIIPLIVP